MKIGDRVRVGQVPRQWFFKTDDTGVITEITPHSSLPYTVKFDTRRSDGGCDYGYCQADQLELIGATAGKDKVLAHLLSGRSITPLEALGDYGIFRLAARIHELKKKGHKIVTTTKTSPTGKTYAEYSLVSRNMRTA